jgi:hypothetical protein
LSIVAEERSLRVYGSETLIARSSALSVRTVQFFCAMRTDYLSRFLLQS